MSASSEASVFSDFCQAWGARFPGSELPDAWEEDVRANLKNHKTKVDILREELQKEEMYVEYLQTLLQDIEKKKARKSSSSNLQKSETSTAPEGAGSSLDEFLESHLSDLKKTDAFVTVINVSSEVQNVGDENLTTAEKSASLPLRSTASSVKASVTKSKKRDSLRSISSPTTPPTSPLISSSTEDMVSREGLAIVNTSSISSSSVSSSKEPLADLDEDMDFDPKPQDSTDVSRGQPDGRDQEEDLDTNTSKASPKSSNNLDSNEPSRASVRELMANWEGRPPVQAKPRSKLPLPSNEASNTSSPPIRTNTSNTRKDSDSSSRGRMGSPSGKSHDSSDSEHNSWSRTDSKKVLNASGEARLDRLVRKPSGERPKVKPRLISSNPDHLYDTVAIDEPEDEVYDNHLLYDTDGKKTDTIGSGGNSSTDLGFDEPPLPARRTGTLSSSDTTSSSQRRLLTDDYDEEEETYVNIQYFLQKRRNTGDSSSESPFSTVGGPMTSNMSMAAFQSDDEIDEVLEEQPAKPPRVIKRQMTDELPATPNLNRSTSSGGGTSTKSEELTMYKCILTSILESEAIYLEALSVMLQYMKAMKVTLSTDQPFIPKEDFEVIFYRVPELHDLHLAFHDSLKKLVERWPQDENICYPFKMLASRTKIYVSYLNNYQKALESLHRCTEAYPPFADLTRSIKLRSVKGQRQGQSLSLEDLLHKPVGRIQKQCLCLQDLIKHTPVDHPDHRSLTEALSTFQELVTDYNTRHAGELFPHQERPQRHLVKNSFIVELAEGQRKLRHLFLFNDVLVCAKYKASGGGHHPTPGVAVGRNQEKFTFQLKWYIPLEHALIVEEPSSEPRESHPANLVSLRTQASSLRDQIHRIEKEEEVKGTLNNRRTSNQIGNAIANLKATEKPRKKLAEVEAQLVLASPSLVFQVSNKQGKAYTFFLSSEYERSQWVETLQVLQSSLPSNHTTSAQAKNMSMYELQAWITSCRKFLKTNMGSFLMRSPRDEPLLVGDLHFKIHCLQGLTRPSDLFVVIEVDSYGHFFRKCKTQLLVNTLEPKWEEEFTIDLEGSENLRILVYEQNSNGPSQLRGRASLELSRSWLTEKMNEQRISMNDVVLVSSMKFVTFEQTMRRVPSNSGSKNNHHLFGANISEVTRRERRPVPFIITSCVREVERRGISEVGIYRVSGSAADVGRLKKAFEANPYEAEQLLKEVDIHSVAGTLKSYLRDLPESLVTTPIYQKMFEAFSTIPSHDSEAKKNALLGFFSQVPNNPNQACVVYLIEHIVKVSQYEQQNKMSLHNLATVFGPTMLHSGSERDKKKNNRESQFTTGTVDVMAQAGILHFFLTRRARGESIQIVERQV